VGISAVSVGTRHGRVPIFTLAACATQHAGFRAGGRAHLR
jgi:hypothetical protein